MKPNISPLNMAIYSITYFLIPHLMLPDAALTLGFAAGTNVSSFASRRENPALCAPRCIGTSVTHLFIPPCDVGLHFFSPALLKAERLWH